MGSLGLPTPRVTDDCSLKQPTIFYLLHTRRMIGGTPSTVGGMHGAPSTLHANDDMRARSVAEKNTTGTTASQPGARLPGLSRQRLRLAAPPGDGRGTTTTTPIPGTDIIPDDRRTHVECRHLLRVSEPFNGPLTSRYPTSTNMNLSRIQEAGWPSTPLLPELPGRPRT
jgi:hypothetical protein